MTNATETKRGTLRAILLKPESASATPLILPRGDGFLEACYSAIGCRLIDIAIPERRDVELILDDEGLLEDPRLFTIFDGNVFAGAVIVTGPADDDGNLTDCPLTLADLVGRVEFARLPDDADGVAA